MFAAHTGTLTFTARALHPRQGVGLRVHPELEHLLPGGLFVVLAVRVPVCRGVGSVRSRAYFFRPILFPTSKKLRNNDGGDKTKKENTHTYTPLRRSPLVRKGVRQDYLSLGAKLLRQKTAPKRLRSRHLAKRGARRRRACDVPRTKESKHLSENVGRQTEQQALVRLLTRRGWSEIFSALHASARVPRPPNSRCHRSRGAFCVA